MLEGSEFKTNNKHTFIVVTNSELTREVTMNVESKGLSDCCFQIPFSFGRFT